MSRAGTKARRRAAGRARTRAAADAIDARFVEIRKTVALSEAVDAVYAWLDEMLLAGRFMDADAVLKRADPASFHLMTMLAFAVITVDARDRLQERAGYVARARASLVSRGRSAEDIADMLEGLE